MPIPTDRSATALIGLRVTVALLLVIHGVARVSLGIVDDFGGFLGLVGFPLGTALAWGITVVEILGGVLLAVGRAVRPLGLYFAAQLTLGIVLVHAQEGWFVVGAGWNGVEYSVLLIVALLAVAYARPAPPEHQKSSSGSRTAPPRPAEAERGGE